MPKISIIVPVYNVEKYLDRCIQSILAQTYTDFELLLVDDGSTDSSAEICDKYAQLDSRVRVFHQPNGGVTSARKLGVDNANGDWITFVDADDYLNDNYIDNFFANVACEYEILICTVNNSSISSSDYIKDLLANRIGWGMWRKLYKISYVNSGDIFNVPREINIGEDIIANIAIAQKCKNVKYIINDGYIIREHNESATKVRKWSIDYEIMFINYLLKILKNVEMFGEELWLLKLRSVKGLLLNGVYISRSHFMYKEILDNIPNLPFGIGDKLILTCPFPRLTSLLLRVINFLKK